MPPASPYRHVLLLGMAVLLEDSTVAVVFLQQLAALGFAVVLSGVAVAVGGTGTDLPADPTTWALAAASGTVYYGWRSASSLAACAASPSPPPLPAASCH